MERSDLENKVASLKEELYDLREEMATNNRNKRKARSGSIDNGERKKARYRQTVDAPRQ
jgi:hypothetical protein